MSIVKAEDVVGYWIESQSVCCGCATTEEVAAVTREQVIENDDYEEDFCFCNRCGKQLAQ